MRIIAGQMKGLRLANVGKGDANAHLRPTTDRVRESLFNVLGNLIDFDGKTVLDVFAGTGALGFEALSRGAKSATFIEKGRIAQKLIVENIRITRTADVAKLIPRDALKLGAGTPHDLIFMDPPYGKGMGERAIESMQSWIAPGAILVWEDNLPPVIPAGWTVLDQRKYGATQITIAEVL